MIRLQQFSMHTTRCWKISSNVLHCLAQYENTLCKRCFWLCYTRHMKTKTVAVILLLTFFALTVFLLTRELPFEIFNLVEGFTWLTLALFVLAAARLIGKKYAAPAWFTVIVLLLFSTSDFIEVTTGAYWQPWWLLGLNVFCVFGLVGALTWFSFLYFRKKA